MGKILFVFTSANKLVGGSETGWHLSEAAEPYYLLSSKYEIDFAAPAGPNPPVDPSSVKMAEGNDAATKFLRDDVVKQKLANAKRLAQVNPDEYDAIYYVGGHGPVMDLAQDIDNARIATALHRANKVIAAICHGPGALVQVSDSQGRSIFAGKEVTSWSNAEEEDAGKMKEVPFALQDRIEELGGKYCKAPNGAENVVRSGNLITGQNPASARRLGDEILKALSAAA